MTEVNDYTKSLQVRLMANGMSVGSAGADGKMGQSTHAALQAVMDKAGLTAVSLTNEPKEPADAPMSGIERPVLTTIPALWMPDAKMLRIHMHWTAGSYTVSEEDLEHYHFIIDGDCKLHKGVHSVKDNEVIHGTNYAAHTLNANSGAIGVSLACMAGAIESPFDAGKYPMKPTQFAALCDVVAQLAHRYSIPVDRKTILSHAEVQPTLGIQQRGKWDYTRLPFDPHTVGAVQVGDKIRDIVRRGING